MNLPKDNEASRIARIEAELGHDESVYTRAPTNKHRNNLALAHMNKGNALQEQRTPESLQQAIGCYDQAIELQLKLDLSVDAYRNNLATTYMNKGNTLKGQSTPESLVQAIACYDEALGMASDDDALRDYSFGEVRASSRLGRSLALAMGSDYVTAGDDAESGLELLRRMEAYGRHALRPLREQLFGLTLRLSIAAGQLGNIPDLIEEHLAPDAPGSAPDSPAMHRAALAALGAGQSALLSGPGLGVEGAGELIGRYQATFNRLTQWGMQYFAATATAAQLRALEREQRGDPAGAAAVLREYTGSRPADPEGHGLLGEFLARHEDWSAAEAAYLEGARRIVHAAPRRAPDAALAARVAALGESILGLHEVSQGLFTLAPDEAGARLESEVGREHAQVAWLVRDFLNTVLAPPEGEKALEATHRKAWRAVLDAALENVRGGFSERCGQWLREYVDAKSEAARRRGREEALDYVFNTTTAALRGVPLGWRGFMEQVLLSFRQTTHGELERYAGADEQRSAGASRPSRGRPWSGPWSGPLSVSIKMSCARRGRCWRDCWGHCGTRYWTKPSANCCAPPCGSRVGRAMSVTRG